MSNIHEDPRVLQICRDAEDREAMRERGEQPPPLRGETITIRKPDHTHKTFAWTNPSARNK